MICPHAVGSIFANTTKQLNDSTLSRVFKVWKQWFGWVDGVDYVVDIIPPKEFNTESHHWKKNEYNGIISFRWGTYIYIGSLENAKAHDGKELSWAFLDETKDTRERDFKEVIVTRMRHPGMYIKDGKICSDTTGKMHCPIYICTSPARTTWLNEMFGFDDFQQEIQATIFSATTFFHKKYDKFCAVISSTFHNIENVGQDYIDDVYDVNGETQGSKLIYGNPFVQSGGDYWADFDVFKHVGKYPYVDGHAIHFTVDFNVRPFITGLCYFVEYIDGIEYITLFDELCLESPHHTPECLAEELIKRHGSKMKEYGFFYYGDCQGRIKQQNSNYTLYQEMDAVWNRYTTNRSDRVPISYPSIISSKNFVNKIFREGYEDIRFRMDESCKNSKNDFLNLKEDSKGKTLKAKTDGVELLGHPSDATRYMAVELYSNRYEEFCL